MPSRRPTLAWLWQKHCHLTTPCLQAPCWRAASVGSCCRLPARRHRAGPEEACGRSRQRGKKPFRYRSQTHWQMLNAAVICFMLAFTGPGGAGIGAIIFVSLFYAHYVLPLQGP